MGRRGRAPCTQHTLALVTEQNAFADVDFQAQKREESGELSCGSLTPVSPGPRGPHWGGCCSLTVQVARKGEQRPLPPRPCAGGDGFPFRPPARARREMPRTWHPLSRAGQLARAGVCTEGDRPICGSRPHVEGETEGSRGGRWTVPRHGSRLWRCLKAQDRDLETSWCQDERSGGALCHGEEIQGFPCHGRGA